MSLQRRIAARATGLPDARKRLELLGTAPQDVAALAAGAAAVAWGSAAYHAARPAARRQVWPDRASRAAAWEPP